MLKERLDRLGHGPEDWQSIVATTDGLISAGIKSAIKTLQILKDEDNLLGEFGSSKAVHADHEVQLI